MNIRHLHPSLPHRWLGLFVLMLAFMMRVSGQSLTSNLLLYMPIMGNAQDYSGNGFQGSSSGSLISDRLGMANEAYFFNGNHQTILLPNNADLHPQLPMSVAMYVNFSTLGSICFANDFSGGVYTGIWIGSLGTGEIHVDYGDGGITTSTYRRSKISNTTISAGTWHHIICVVRSALDMDIYIDCANAGGYYDGQGGPMAYANRAGQLGVASALNMPNNAAYMTGMVDEVAFWGRALTAADVEKVCAGELHTLFKGTATQPESASQDDISIYPVPARDQIHVALTEKLRDAALLQLIDIAGKVLLDIMPHGQMSFDIDIAKYAAGVYYLRALAADGRFISKKFTKE